MVFPLRALVTGGGGGFGAALARELAARGHRVAVTVRPEGARSGGRALPPGVEVLRADARDAAAVRRAGREAAALLGGDLTAWVVNAAAYADPALGALGLGLLGQSEGVAFDEWAEQATRCAHTNFLGALWGIRAAVEAAPPAGANVYLVLGSGSDGAPAHGHAAYGATKAAARAFAECAHAELREAGVPVGVHLLSPGPMRTALMADHLAALPPGPAAGLLRRLSLDPADAAAEAVRAMEAVQGSRQQPVRSRRIMCFPGALRRAIAKLL